MRHRKGAQARGGNAQASNPQQSLLLSGISDRLSRG
jgi:hypothetical protein